MTLTHWKAIYWLNSIICPKNNSDINWFFSRWVWTKHTLLLTWPWLFEGKITLFTRLTSIQWIAQCALLTLLRWIAIYPLDSVIHPSNNKGRIEIYSMESKWSFISTTRAKNKKVYRWIICETWQNAGWNLIPSRRESTTLSDKRWISLHNINTFSSRKVMRSKKSIK